MARKTEMLSGINAAKVGMWLVKHKDEVKNLYSNEIVKRLDDDGVIKTSPEALTRLLRSMEGEIEFKDIRQGQGGGFQVFTKQFPHIRTILIKVVAALGEKELGLTQEELEVIKYIPKH